MQFGVLSTTVATKSDRTVVITGSNNGAIALIEGQLNSQGPTPEEKYEKIKTVLPEIYAICCYLNSKRNNNNNNLTIISNNSVSSNKADFFLQTFRRKKNAMLQDETKYKKYKK